MEIQKDRTKSATLAALGTCVIYGFSFMASRIALQHAPAAIMLAIRFLVAMLVMLLLLASGRFRIDLKRKPVGRFLLMGLCQPVIYFIGETNDPGGHSLALCRLSSRKDVSPYFRMDRLLRHRSFHNLSRTDKLRCDTAQRYSLAARGCHICCRFLRAEQIHSR